jgi:hypothetical protein
MLTLDKFKAAAERFSNAEQEVISVWKERAACNCSQPGELEACWNCPYNKQLGRLIQQNIFSEPDKSCAKIPPPEWSDLYAPEIKKMCCTMYEYGYSIKDIQELVGIPQRRQLRQWLRESGLASRSAQYPPHVKQKCLDLYAERWTVRQIEDDTGVPGDTITDWVYVEGIARTSKYPEETKKNCLDLYKQGKTSELIHQMTGIPVVTINSWIAKAGIGRGRKRYSEKQKKRCLALYLEGNTAREVEEKTGVKRVTIRSWIRQRNLESPASERRKNYATVRHSRKPSGYWKSIDHVAKEVRAVNEARGEIDYIPSVRELNQLGRGDLIHAISKHHGGFQCVAEYMGLKFRKRRSRYWHDFENLKQELLSYIEECGTPGVMPTKQELENSDKRALSAALSIHGGVAQVAQRLNLRFSYDRKPRNYWKDFQNLEAALQAINEQLGNPSDQLPTYAQLQEIGRTDLISAVSKSGGWPSVAERMGVTYERTESSSPSDRPQNSEATALSQLRLDL